MATAKFSIDLAGQALNGRYLLEARIGRGGFADVYRAVDTRTREFVAIKVLHADHTRSITDVARFSNEAKIAGRIEDEHFVRGSDFFQDRRHFCFVMEYLQGSSLREVLRDRSGEPMSWPRAFEIALEVCAGLDVAHSLNVIHRDIKPENLFLARARGGDEQVKILDLGLAKVLQDHTWQGLGDVVSNTGIIVGSPPYIAPERVHGNRTCTTSVDIYSLGIVLFEMVAGVVPFRGSSPFETLYHHVHTEPVRPTTLVPGLRVPTGLEDIILRAIRKGPEDRFRTIREMELAIRQELERKNIDQRPARSARLPPAVPDDAVPTVPLAGLPPLSVGQSEPSGGGEKPEEASEPTTVKYDRDAFGPGRSP